MAIRSTISDTSTIFGPDKEQVRGNYCQAISIKKKVLTQGSIKCPLLESGYLSRWNLYDTPLKGAEREDENHSGIVSFSGRTCPQVSNKIVMNHNHYTDFDF